MATNKIAHRVDSAADWTSNNPTLVLGEEGIESDTGRRKVGDGVTAWTGLGYSIGTAAAEDYEEGTWTPVADTNCSVSSAVGWYTKFGRVVIAQMALNVTPATTADFVIGGLPFVEDAAVGAPTSFPYTSLFDSSLFSGSGRINGDKITVVQSDVFSGAANTGVNTARCVLVYQTS